MPKIFFLMVYPITLWLWAWLFAGPSVSGPVNPAFEPGGFSTRPTSSLYDSGFYPALMGELKIRPTIDSGFYRTLALNLQQRLSETRAGAVKNYLLEKGVAADRLASTGYGSSQLLNQEKTSAERSLNRRVELKLKNN